MSAPARPKRGPPANYTPGRPSNNARYQPAPSDDIPASYPPNGSNDDPSSTSSPDKLASVNQRVNDVKSSLQKNIELAITRGEKIDEMAEKSEQLAEDASTFQASARKVRQKLWARYWKLIAIAVVVAVLLIVIIVVSVSNKSS